VKKKQDNEKEKVPGVVTGEGSFRRGEKTREFRAKKNVFYCRRGEKNWGVKHGNSLLGKRGWSKKAPSTMFEARLGT